MSRSMGTLCTSTRRNLPGETGTSINSTTRPSPNDTTRLTFIMVPLQWAGRDNLDLSNALTAQYLVAKLAQQANCPRSWAAKLVASAWGVEIVAPGRLALRRFPALAQ